MRSFRLPADFPVRLAEWLLVVACAVSGAFGLILGLGWLWAAMTAGSSNTLDSAVLGASFALAGACAWWAYVSFTYDHLHALRPQAPGLPSTHMALPTPTAPWLSPVRPMSAGTLVHRDLRGMGPLSRPATAAGRALAPAPVAHPGSLSAPVCQRASRNWLSFERQFRDHVAGKGSSGA
jgi:hypothetical protein